MAVTSIWPIKGKIGKVIDYAMNPEKTISSSSQSQLALHVISGVAEYAADEMKTEHRELVTGINCAVDIAAEEFIRTKNHYDKRSGRICYHGYQSFAHGEVNAELAHKIGVELATKLWGSRFEVLVATHCNTGCYHNHFVINSVSFVDGGKFYNSHEDYRKMRELSDELCRKYSLSVVTSRGHGKNHGEWEAEQEGRPTRRSMICDDIERAICASLTQAEFRDAMQEMGYTFKTETASGSPLKYPAIRPPGAKGFFRFHKLGKGYSWDEIMDRIANNDHRNLPFPEAERRKNLPKAYPPYPKATGLRALYYRYCYELHIIVKHPTSTKRVHFALREDITKLEQLDAQSRFLASYQIDTLEQLKEVKNSISSDIHSLDSERRTLRRQLSKAGTDGDKDSIQAQIDDLNRIRKEMRKELVLCDAIERRSTEIDRNLEILENEQEYEKEIERKEENEHEQFWRSSRSGREDVSEWY